MRLFITLNEYDGIVGGCCDLNYDEEIDIINVEIAL